MRNGEPVIARGNGQHAARSLFFSERRELRHRSAKLERTRQLKTFEFEKYIALVMFGKPARALERRAARERGDSPLRVLHIFDRQVLSRFVHIQLHVGAALRGRPSLVSHDATTFEEGRPRRAAPTWLPHTVLI